MSRRNSYNSFSSTPPYMKEEEVVVVVETKTNSSNKTQTKEHSITMTKSSDDHNTEGMNGTSSSRYRSLSTSSSWEDLDEAIVLLGTKSNDASKKIGVDNVKIKVETSTTSSSTVISFACCFVWPAMLTLPLILTSSYSFTSYRQLFPQEWYAYDDGIATPKPLGLVLGITAVGIGQITTLLFFYIYKFYIVVNNTTNKKATVQSKGAVLYNFWTEGIQVHVCQPEGFGLLITYLSVTWMFHLMPSSYYSFDGSIQYKELLLCLLLQDCFQYIMHRLEHDLSPKFYQLSHKPHHVFINPKLFDSFNGSITDTICMIIIPLYMTATVMRNVNVWTYMAFGSTYSCWLTLIHSEYNFPWDQAFRVLKMGTPADHHVHHKFFKYNFGHLFMYWDIIAGTYRNPKSFGEKTFNV